MPFNTIPTTFSVRDLQRKYREVIDAAKHSKDAVVLIKNSRPEAVVLDVETYDELVRDTYPYDEAFTLSAVKKSRVSAKAGKAKKLSSWDDLDA
ncbi:TPA: hypothetical protein DDZ10_00095 [Candidatus Uhrbacteria bacterium]|uniref:Antitoxin n=1 Tax=Candidatus Uhrbacteria bacterium GW2011_GWC2_53_7 TaxID=1618986 RepID=A0A0G2A7E0_9BACT|nr:MAG: hypothetical protein UY82_C0010G0006 [Candidatus Uhrbacteria bacterium GW2011_GWC2_53_7]OGL72217.1 MAG: hypothetical protein A3D69_03860 [Candidatus Uhrbacteria bacterium RIFCSPHIGHO2_02_FULL_54_11]HBL39068.1 hypothetical protein [Candidatus Uhrbacteria bacterium]